jgi:hypothetical protein
MSSWGNFLLYDPHDLERLYSNEDAFSELPSVWGELQEESFEDMDRVKELLELIPPREADFLELYFFKKVKQTSIAEIFNISQPTVCYRLKRATARIKFLLDLSPFSILDMEKDLRGFLKDPTDVAVMMGMLRTTCQSDVARELNVTQGFVRHRFFRTLTSLEGSDTCAKYVPAFSKVRENFNMLKNHNRASWNEDVIYQVG